MIIVAEIIVTIATATVGLELQITGVARTGICSSRSSSTSSRLAVKLALVAGVIVRVVQGIVTEVIANGIVAERTSWLQQV